MTLQLRDQHSINFNWGFLAKSIRTVFSDNRGSLLDSNVSGIRTNCSNNACRVRFQRDALISCEADTPGHCYRSRLKAPSCRDEGKSAREPRKYTQAFKRQSVARLRLRESERASALEVSAASERTDVCNFHNEKASTRSRSIQIAQSTLFA